MKFLKPKKAIKIADNFVAIEIKINVKSPINTYSFYVRTIAAIMTILLTILLYVLNNFFF